MSLVKQCDHYKAKTDLVIGRCKPKAGDIFWITSPTYSNNENCTISRKGKGSLSQGYLISIKDLHLHFEKV